MRMSGATALLRVLESHNIKRVFGYPGGCIMPLYDALLSSSIDHILCRHEQACAFAANGYARFSGELSVAIATSGPGATNLITGVADAQSDSVPMLIITGQVSSSLIGSDAFQETDVLGLSLGITKHSFLVNKADEVAPTIYQAIDIALSGRPGPVWVDITKDALQESTQYLTDIRSNSEANNSALHTNSDDVQAAEALRQCLQQSHKPLLFTGGGIAMAQATHALRRFIEKTQIPCVETLKGLGNAPANYLLDLGMIGMHGSRAANRALQECDLLICMGARFDDRATGKTDDFAPKASIIHLDADASEFNKNINTHQAFTCQLATTLDCFTEKHDPPLNISDWRKQCQELQQSFSLRDHGNEAPANNTGITGPQFLKHLEQIKPTNSIICCDVGQHQMWVAQHMTFNTSRHHLTSGGLGAMGFGLPAAIGACYAAQDNHESTQTAPIFAISGDGSFLMNVQELATLHRYQIPVKIIVLNNDYLGMVRQQQELFYNRQYSECDLSDNPAFEQVAQAFSIPNRLCEEQSQVGDCLNWLLAQPGPALLHVKIQPEENVWPMVPPGAANHQMLEKIS